MCYMGQKVFAKTGKNFISARFIEITHSHSAMIFRSPNYHLETLEICSSYYDYLHNIIMSALTLAYCQEIQINV